MICSNPASVTQALLAASSWGEDLVCAVCCEALTVEHKLYLVAGTAGLRGAIAFLQASARCWATMNSHYMITKIP